MGIKHLKAIVDLLKTEKNPVSKVYIRDKLKMDYNSLLDHLDYLDKAGEIKKTEINGVEKWGKK